MNKVQPIRDISKIEEVKNILKHMSYRDYFMFVFGINTGLRISDIIPLKVKDVRNQNYIILVEQKTTKSKRFLINNDLSTEINEYTKGMDDQDYLFPSKKGSHIKRGQAYKIINTACKKAGLGEIGTHTLRKTFGFHFYNKTKDVAMLQIIFGHSSPSYTLRYIGIEQDQIDQEIRNFSL